MFGDDDSLGSTGNYKAARHCLRNINGAQFYIIRTNTAAQRPCQLFHHVCSLLTKQHIFSLMQENPMSTVKSLVKFRVFLNSMDHLLNQFELLVGFNCLQIIEAAVLSCESPEPCFAITGFRGIIRHIAM